MRSADAEVQVGQKGLWRRGMLGGAGCGRREGSVGGGGETGPIIYPQIETSRDLSHVLQDEGPPETSPPVVMDLASQPCNSQQERPSEMDLPGRTITLRTGPISSFPPE